jgi:hypothetical protein
MALVVLGLIEDDADDDALLLGATELLVDD